MTEPASRIVEADPAASGGGAASLQAAVTGTGLAVDLATSPFTVRLPLAPGTGQID
jgi:hypothetical protein